MPNSNTALLGKVPSILIYLLISLNTNTVDSLNRDTLVPGNLSRLTYYSCYISEVFIPLYVCPNTNNFYLQIYLSLNKLILIVHNKYNLNAIQNFTFPVLTLYNEQRYYILSVQDNKSRVNVLSGLLTYSVSMGQSSESISVVLTAR